MACRRCRRFRQCGVAFCFLRSECYERVFYHFTCYNQGTAPWSKLSCLYGFRRVILSLVLFCPPWNFKLLLWGKSEKQSMFEILKGRGHIGRRTCRWKKNLKTSVRWTVRMFVKILCSSALLWRRQRSFGYVTAKISWQGEQCQLFKREHNFLQLLPSEINMEM